MPAEGRRLSWLKTSHLTVSNQYFLQWIYYQLICVVLENRLYSKFDLLFDSSRLDLMTAHNLLLFNVNSVLLKILVFCATTLLLLLLYVLVVWRFVLQINCVFLKHQQFHRQQVAVVSILLLRKIDVFNQMLLYIQTVAVQHMMSVHQTVCRALVMIVQIGGRCFFLYPWGLVSLMSIQSTLMPWRCISLLFTILI